MLGRLRFALPLVLAAIAPVLSLALSSSSCSLSGLASGGAGPTSSSSGTGGAASTSSAAGGSATGGGGSGGSLPITCPSDMVQVDVREDDGAIVSFCIDRLEVTNADYLTFLADAAPPVSGSNDVCGWNTTLEPSVHPDAAAPMAPVLGVDWCDARAYCRARKKRLCGNLAGGGLNFTEMNFKNDQWYAACSNNNAEPYPYGTIDVSPSWCRDCDRDAGCDPAAPIGPDAAAPVGSIGTCEGGVPGLFDMSGNAWEWQDACDDGGTDGGKRAPEYDHCYRRGGGYDVPHEVDDGGGSSSDKCLACTSCTSGKAFRKSRAADTGLRCCLDLSP